MYMEKYKKEHRQAKIILQIDTVIYKPNSLLIEQAHKPVHGFHVISVKKVFLSLHRLSFRFCSKVPQ